MLCHFELDRHCWHAHTWSSGSALHHMALSMAYISLDYWHIALADNQSVSQCRHQQCQRQQIYPFIDLDTG